ncbi:MAG: hypothetical protein HYX78_09405 [Armatimonadetes bacterium]|nr:hypothetical protein [Armatimonadota bacterium]
MSDPVNQSPRISVTNSDPDVGVYGMLGKGSQDRINRAYLYVKNLTSTWYNSAGKPDQHPDLTYVPTPTDIPTSTSITITNLEAGTYVIERWSTRPGDINANDPHLGFLKGTRTVGPLNDGDSLTFNPNWDGNGDPLPLYGSGEYDWAYKIYKQ